MSNATDGERDSGAAPTDYDAVVIGGAIAGSSVARLLKRRAPAARVLILEREERFDRKVGEATVEVSSFFLYRVLGMFGLATGEHLLKHGLRLWFHERPDATLEEMCEIGPLEAPRLPTFQLDRAKLDESLLAEAAAAGIEVARPARVADLALGWPASTVAIEDRRGARRLSARWVIDASGRQAVIGRKLGIIERYEEQPTCAAWARFAGVVDLDGPAVQGQDPARPRLAPVRCSRRLATNHFMGYGYWAWVIPLPGGATSIGLVWNENLWSPPAGTSPRESLERFVREHPGLRKIAGAARIEGDDFYFRRHLAYRARRTCDRGWVLVGDAANFMDPLYSPGLDNVAFSTYAAAALVGDELAGRTPSGALAAAVELHDRRFQIGYRRFWGAIYRDKYELMGDAELFAAAFFQDIAMYYWGVVQRVHRDVEQFRIPPLGDTSPLAEWAFRFIGGYQRRIVALARERRRHGTYGRGNEGARVIFRGFGLEEHVLRTYLRGLRAWLRAELHGLGLRCGIGRRPQDVARGLGDREALLVPRPRASAELGSTVERAPSRTRA
jgi:flavin-dependent dehydrogenase